MKDKRAELVLAFTDALGAFVSEGLKGLTGDTAVLVSLAHERGTGAIRIIVDTVPVTITVLLQPTDETLQPVTLFTIHNRFPSGNFQ